MCTSDAEDDLGYPACGDSAASMIPRAPCFTVRPTFDSTGSNEYRGAVQILDDITEEWHSVCGDDNWDMDDATAVCNLWDSASPWSTRKARRTTCKPIRRWTRLGTV